jgi:hypothetical protein
MDICTNYLTKENRQSILVVVVSDAPIKPGIAITYFTLKRLNAIFFFYSSISTKNYSGTSKHSQKLSRIDVNSEMCYLRREMQYLANRNFLRKINYQEKV